MNKRRRLMTVTIVIFLVLDLAVAAVLGYVIWQGGQAQTSRRDVLAQKIGIRPEMSAEQQQEALLSTLGDADRHVTMKSEAEAAQNMAAVMLVNAGKSQCAVTVEILRLATGETIAQSGLIDPGWRLEEIALNTSLPQGEHQCLARLRYYTQDGEVELGVMARQILLRVK